MFEENKRKCMSAMSNWLLYAILSKKCPLWELLLSKNNLVNEEGEKSSFLIATAVVKNIISLKESKVKIVLNLVLFQLYFSWISVFHNQERSSELEKCKQFAKEVFPVEIWLSRSDIV